MLNLNLENIRPTPSVVSGDADFEDSHFSKYPYIDIADVVFQSRNRAIAIETLRAIPEYSAYIPDECPESVILKRANASMESVIQDILESGLIYAFISGPVLAKLSRIRSYCRSAQNKVNIRRTLKSTYLIPADRWAYLSKVIATLMEVIDMVLKNPDKVKPEDVNRKLEPFVREGVMMTRNWKAAAVGLLARGATTALTWYIPYVPGSGNGSLV